MLSTVKYMNIPSSKIKVIPDSSWGWRGGMWKQRRRSVFLNAHRYIQSSHFFNQVHLLLFQELKNRSFEKEVFQVTEEQLNYMNMHSDKSLKIQMTLLGLGRNENFQNLLCMLCVLTLLQCSYTDLIKNAYLLRTLTYLIKLNIKYLQKQNDE